MNKKRRPLVKAMAKNVNVRMDPGADYPVAAQPGYPDDVAVICHRTVKDGPGKGHREREPEQVRGWLGVFRALQGLLEWTGTGITAGRREKL